MGTRRRGSSGLCCIVVLPLLYWLYTEHLDCLPWVADKHAAGA
jgi:hypothetical protein